MCFNGGFNLLRSFGFVSTHARSDTAVGIREHVSISYGALGSFRPQISGCTTAIYYSVSISYGALGSFRPQSPESLCALAVTSFNLLRSFGFVSTLRLRRLKQSVRMCFNLLRSFGFVSTNCLTLHGHSVDYVSISYGALGSFRPRMLPAASFWLICFNLLRSFGFVSTGQSSVYIGIGKEVSISYGALGSFRPLRNLDAIGTLIGFQSPTELWVRFDPR